MPVKDKPVAVIMGSQSDWKTMRHAAETLEALGIGYVASIVSAHRTPDRLVTFAKGAKTAGFKVIIAGAGGAAHLPGMTAAMTALPVFGVPIETKTLFGQPPMYSVPLPPDTSILGSNLYSVPGDDIRGFHSGNLHAYIRVYFVKGYI